jgi:hypothetical protein
MEPFPSAIVGAVVVGLAVIIAYSIADRRWCKRQRRRMESDRPHLSDAEFLDSVPVGPNDGPFWLAVRRAVAESVGLPPEAIYPEDPLADLWRMQSLGPDLLDIIFRMERSLGVKISRRSLGSCMDLRYGQNGEFRDFAASLVRAIGRPDIVAQPGS